MFNSAFFIRVLIALFGAIILIAILPAVLRLVGFPVSADLTLVIKLVIAAIAVFYIFKG
jgi:hypothetical protein